MKKYLFIVLLVGVYFGQNIPPYSGTIFIDGDIITEDDSSTFVSAPYIGEGMRTMYDRRLNDWITVNAYLFDASFNDQLTCEIQVNPEFATIDNASIEAEKYGKEIGRLPTCLRNDVETVWIHQGTEPFGGGNNNILIHTGQAINYINSGILEETLVHEASHTSLDLYHSSSAGWLNAQTQDNHFISTYAQDHPEREDIAESFLVYLAIQHRSDRISDNTYQTIVQTIPNRIEYFNSQGFDMYPIVIDDYSGPIWYIATTGSNETGNGSAENPFASIQKGVDLADNGDTIKITNGVYGGDAIDFGMFSDNYKNIIIIGENMDSTIFSPTIQHNAIRYSNNVLGERVDSTYIHLKNITIKGRVWLVDIKNISLNGVKIISQENSVPLMLAGLMDIDGPLVSINNSVFINKHSSATNLAGNFSNFEINYSTFIGQTRLDIFENSNPVEIRNSIIWGDTLEINESYADINISHSIVEGGFEGLGNLNIDPLFCNPENGDYSLAVNSPAFGTGENGSNIGALGIGCDEVLSINEDLLPKVFTLHQNYPNPFNPITSLMYYLPKDDLVNITIYDIMGRVVKTLVNGSQTAGFKSVQWNATNDRNEPVSAGLYLYSIQAGEFRQTKKMVLLK